MLYELFLAKWYYLNPRLISLIKIVCVFDWCDPNPIIAAELGKRILVKPIKVGQSCAFWLSHDG